MPYMECAPEIICLTGVVRKKTGLNSARLEFLYHLPYTEELGPMDDPYFIDWEE